MKIDNRNQNQDECVRTTKILNIEVHNVMFELKII